MKWLIIIIVALLIKEAQVMAAEPQPGDYGNEAPRVVVAAPENPRFAHLAWPKIVKTNDGTLVLAYSAGRFHGDAGEGCPAVSISKDGGQTFTPPNILREFSPETEYDNSANTALGIAADGSVVLLAMAYTNIQRNSVFGWRSTDSGETWTPVDTSNLADGKTGSVYGHIFEVPGKGLAVTGHFRRGSKDRTQGIWIAYSTDHGQTWGEPELIVGDRMVEPAVVMAGDRMIGMFRNGTARHYHWLAVSDNQLKNWQVSAWPQGADNAYMMPSPFLAVSPVNPQRIIALQAQRHLQGNLPGHIHLWSADTKTLEWERLGTLVNFPKELGRRNDITYPWMVHLEGDEWFMVFYCGQPRGASDIYGMKVRIPE